jgi:hypothetical protein
VSSWRQQKNQEEEMMTLRVFVATVAVALGAIADVQAQDYPSRPITMIVPFAAGGPTDTLGRIMAEGMRPSLGQTVIVRKRLTDLGQVIATPEQQTPAALGAFQKAEIEKWWPIIRAANIKVEAH